MESKGKIRRIVQMWVDENKPAPFPEGAKIGERFTVTGPKRASVFDPANFHPTEKVVIDVLVQNGLLPDDNGEVIPEAAFCYGGRRESGYEFRVELFEVQ